MFTDEELVIARRRAPERLSRIDDHRAAVRLSRSGKTTAEIAAAFPRQRSTNNFTYDGIRAIAATVEADNRP
ncbi:hypothetical protein [Mycolicibacter minnesotensis]